MKSMIHTLVMSIVLCGYAPTMMGAATIRRKLVAAGVSGVAIGAAATLGATYALSHRGSSFEQYRAIADNQALSLLIDTARFCGKPVTHQNAESHIALLTVDAVKPDKATLTAWVKGFTSGDHYIFAFYRDGLNNLLERYDVLLHDPALKAVPAKNISESQRLAQLASAHDMLCTLKVLFNSEFHQEISDERTRAKTAKDAELKLILEVREHNKCEALAKRMDGQDARMEEVGKRLAAIDANTLKTGETIAAHGEALVTLNDTGKKLQEVNESLVKLSTDNAANKAALIKVDADGTANKAALAKLDTDTAATRKALEEKQKELQEKMNAQQAELTKIENRVSSAGALIIGSPRAALGARVRALTQPAPVDASVEKAS